jgi:uncharacterized protein (TIGR02145 family)
MVTSIRHFILPTLISIFLIACEKEKDDPETVKDIDGNTYHTVIIGSQTWLIENLSTTRFNDGTAILLVTENSAWEGLNSPGYCWYNNVSDNKEPYGALYNWHTVNTGKLCPTGWHVPTRVEWSELLNYLGGDSIAGGKLKEQGNVHWAFPNYGATNESEFTALPGGARFYQSQFMNLNGFWWSSTENNTTAAWRMAIEYGDTHVYSYFWSKKYGLSVRCLLD